MWSKRIAIGLALSITFTPVVLAPVSATALPRHQAADIKAAQTKASECAKEVETRGLRGKPAKKFRAQCEKTPR